MANDPTSPCLSDSSLRRYHAMEMSDVERDVASRHLAQCSSCAAQLEALKAAQKPTLGSLQDMDIDSDLHKRPPVTSPGGVGETATISPPARPLPFPVIEGYEILKEIKGGGQGVVYQVVQRSTRSKVAIKVLREGAFATSAARERFKREIELVAQLKHPNIINIFDSGATQGGQLYCVMDYIRGHALHEYVREHRLSLDESLRLFSAVCDAVQYAHHKGVIHRDLKPSNILVDSEGVPKVLDFGLAKQLLEPLDKVVSLTGQIVGTLPYMSPEQTRGNPDEIDMRTDIYALGVILYELLTGHYPYPVVGTLVEVLRHIAETPPTPPSRVWTGHSGVIPRPARRLPWRPRRPIEDDLETIVLKALAKERGRRYQSVTDLAQDVQQYLVGGPISAKRDSGWYVLRKMIGQHRQRIAVVLAVILAIGSAFTYERSRRKQIETQAGDLNQEGYRFETYQDMEKAEAKYKEALDRLPGFSKALGNLCRLQLERYAAVPRMRADANLLTEALDYCRQATASNPSSPGPWNNQALALMLRGKFDEAAEVSHRALKEKPDYYWAHSDLAKALALQGKLDEARQEALEATKSAHDVGASTSMYTAPLWHTRAVLEMRLGESEAWQSLENAIVCKRDDAWAYALRVRWRLAAAKPDVEAALRDAVVADAVAPVEDARIKRTIAYAYARASRFTEALEFAEAALKLDNEHPHAMCIKAWALAGLGRKDEAKVAMEKAATAAQIQFADPAVPKFSVDHGHLWYDTAEEFQMLLDAAGAQVSAE